MTVYRHLLDCFQLRYYGIRRKGETVVKTKTTNNGKKTNKIEKAG